MSKQKDQQALDVNNALATSEAMIIKYKKPIITALAVVVIAVGGFFAYLYGYAKPHEDKAQELLGIVMQKYIAQQDFEHALKGEGKTAGLLKIADEYSSTDAAIKLASATTIRESMPKPSSILKSTAPAATKPYRHKLSSP